MSQLRILGGKQLEGEVWASGSKNAVLPILAASLLTEDVITLSNIPYLGDVATLFHLLRTLGARIIMQERDSFSIQASDLCCFEVPYALVSKMRASILILGPLLSRFGYARIPLPGGCAIGARPVNIHIAGLRKMGATIEIEEGYIVARVDGRLQGATLHLSENTVTGTENLIMAAVLAKGTTVIEGAAREPEVEDLADFLNKLGAKIEGAGTNTVLIHGVEKLRGGCYSVMPDRIEIGTYLVAAAMTRGSVTVQNVQPERLAAILDVLQNAGAQLEVGATYITLDMCGRRPRAVDISTGPYPGVPTDMQPQFMAMNVIAQGNGHIKENIFENRFMHVESLRKMGAHLRLEANTVTSQGRERLYGAEVEATDLRASAALVLAGLVAEGETVIHAVHHIDRGYELLEEKFSKLGAEIYRVTQKAPKN
eukprot:TRINITY_DN14231_c0_g1_i1.p1 TRINITY_DN14231_c0_g1~~TRINITY_DN14231_c0_g1_i1.p1  ORF type:complete len:426 (+),score=-75.24 TRINITY_DN14231_c0_g1_i1:112-1389(+)